MSLFGAIVRTAVNVAVLPAKVAADAVMAVNEVGGAECDRPGFGHRTKEQLRRLKEEADAD